MENHMPSSIDKILKKLSKEEKDLMYLYLKNLYIAGVYILKRSSEN